MRALASLAVCLLLFCSPALAQFGGTNDGRPQESVQVSTIHLDVQRKVAAYLKQINLHPSPPAETFLGNGQGGGGFGGGGFDSAEVSNTPQPEVSTQPANTTPVNQSGGFF